MFGITQSNLPTTTSRSCCILKLRQEPDRTRQNVPFLLSQPLGKHGGKAPSRHVEMSRTSPRQIYLLCNLNGNQGAVFSD